MQTTNHPCVFLFALSSANLLLNTRIAKIKLLFIFLLFLHINPYIPLIVVSH